MSSQIPAVAEPLALVTGATGFVGTALCKRLVQRGFRVNAALRKEASLDLASKINPIVVGEIDANTQWKLALQEVKVVFHLAARVHVMKEHALNPLKEFRKVNVEGTDNLARAAAASGVKRLVYVSSIGVNGTQTAIGSAFSEKDMPSPHNPYSISKWEAEQKLLEVSASTGLEIVILRPPLIYGKNAPGNFAKMLSFIRSGFPLPLGSVKNLRSLIYLENLVNALIVCASHPKAAGQTYLVSDGEDISTPELLTQLGLAYGKAPYLLPCSPMLLSGVAQALGKSNLVFPLLTSLRINSQKIHQDLHWTAPYSLTQGIRASVKQVSD